MALKQLSTGYYIKIDLEGNVKMYETPESRALEKTAPTFEIVKAKYLTILNTFFSNKERLYYDPDFNQQFIEWQSEYNCYLRSYFRGLQGNEFPLISKYIANVKDSLPRLIHTGKIRVDGTTLNEVYEYIKKWEFFGEVEDC
jgi:hypothetical protein